VVVVFAENDDLAAKAILNTAAEDLASLINQTTEKLGLSSRPFPLALAGGVLIGAPTLRDTLLGKLGAIGIDCEPRVVDDPLIGCLRLANPIWAALGVEWAEITSR
jgi:hypothetical protein